MPLTRAQLCDCEQRVLRITKTFAVAGYVDEVYLPQAREINSRYQPDLIWSDGDWEAPSSFWKSPELL